ncbi:hypothetical protein TrRE_jg9625 [Triparma retinervis]|uniref:Uncharacterized protein n=1 Tax=Triparma retinervis TaxID=2557542 RepID=A0A9W7FXT4_9STRA|nr:hypothetical protein TrRE_jg9625 [Triparma retinervis]
MSSVPQASSSTSLHTTIPPTIPPKVVILEVKNFKKEYKRNWCTVRLRVERLAASSGSLVDLYISDPRVLDVGSSSDEEKSRGRAYNTHGEHLFARCKGLRKLTLPHVETIIGWAFSYCEDLVEAELPSLWQLGSAAFFMCTSLSDLHVPECWILESYALEGCVRLLNVDINIDLVVEEQGFFECDALVKKAERAGYGMDTGQVTDPTGGQGT